MSIAQLHEDISGGIALGVHAHIITVKEEGNGFLVRRGTQEITRLTSAFLAKSKQPIDAGVLALKFSAAFDGAPLKKIDASEIHKRTQNAFRRLGLNTLTI